MRRLKPRVGSNGDNNDRVIIPTIFEHDPDSRLSQYKNVVESLFSIFSRFNIPKSQAKAYIFLAKYGLQTASSVSKSLRIPRTETYAVLNNLGKIGLVTTVIGHPSKFLALPFKEAMSTLIISEQQRITELKKNLKEFERVWNEIPVFSHSSVGKTAKFQTLQGKNQIIAKINEMCNSAKELLVLGDEKDYMMFYHSDILDLMNKSNANVRLLASCSKRAMRLFDKMDHAKIENIPDPSIKNVGFIIKDDIEAIFFIKNELEKPQELIAVKTDSISIISSLKLNFNLLWSSRKSVDKLESNDIEEQSEFKVRELKQQTLILEELNDYLKSKVLIN